jgi:hypothetical protein
MISLVRWGRGQFLSYLARHCNLLARKIKHLWSDHFPFLYLWIHLKRKTSFCISLYYIYITQHLLLFLYWWILLLFLQRWQVVKTPNTSFDYDTHTNVLICIIIYWLSCFISKFLILKILKDIEVHVLLQLSLVPIFKNTGAEINWNKITTTTIIIAWISFKIQFSLFTDHLTNWLLMGITWLLYHLQF